MITDKLTHSESHCVEIKWIALTSRLLSIINLDLNVCLQQSCVGVFYNSRRRTAIVAYKQDLQLFRYRMRNNIIYQLVHLQKLYS